MFRKKNQQKSIMPLFVVMLFDHTSANITFPVLTLLFFDLQSKLFPASASHALRSLLYGTCIAIPHIINALSIPILSILSDHLGRKKILFVCALGTFAFATIATFGIVIGSVFLVILARAVSGIFSRTNAVAQAAVADVSHGKNKILYMSYLQFVIAMGAFAGPVMGGFFAHSFYFKQLNFSLPYILAGIFAMIAVFLTAFYFQETKPILSTKEQVSTLFKNSLGLLKDKKVILISLILLFFQLSWSLYYQYMPPLIKNQFAFGPHSIGVFVALIAVWLSIATLFGIKPLKKYMNADQILFCAACISLAGLLLTLLAVTLPFNSTSHLLLWISAAPVAIGDVIAYICITTLYSDAVNAHQQGAVMGLCLFIVSIAWAFTGFLGGLFSAITTNLPIIISPLGIVCFFLLWWYSRAEHAKTKANL